MICAYDLFRWFAGHPVTLKPCPSHSPRCAFRLWNSRWSNRTRVVQLLCGLSSCLLHVSDWKQRFRASRSQRWFALARKTASMGKPIVYVSYTRARGILSFVTSYRIPYTPFISQRIGTRLAKESLIHSFGHYRHNYDRVSPDEYWIHIFAKVILM